MWSASGDRCHLLLELWAVSPRCVRQVWEFDRPGGIEVLQQLWGTSRSRLSSFPMGWCVNRIARIPQNFIARNTRIKATIHALARRRNPCHSWQSRSSIAHKHKFASWLRTSARSQQLRRRRHLRLRKQQFSWRDTLSRFATTFTDFDIGGIGGLGDLFVPSDRQQAPQLIVLHRLDRMRIETGSLRTLSVPFLAVSGHRDDAYIRQPQLPHSPANFITIESG